MISWFPWNLRLQKLRDKLLHDPYYRLQSGEEIHLAAQLGMRIDVNQANVDDWLRLPGLSIHQGRSLVALSRSGVKFYCIEDIAAALSLPIHRLEPLKPLLSFTYYDEHSLLHHQSININTASIETLLEIPTIDMALAEAVVKNRLAGGDYRNLVDFQNRLGLSGDLVSKLMYYLHFQ
ncbi:MAG: hypothetical protein RLZZ29_1243 [Cyanobacteriota bacterium]|jgi:DNA uptake protein ComE-like DNA-binding protein